MLVKSGSIIEGPSSSPGSEAFPALEIKALNIYVRRKNMSIVTVI